MNKHLPIAPLAAVNEPHVDRYIVELGYKQQGTSLRKFESFQLDPEVACRREAIVRDILGGQIEVDGFTTIWHASTDEPLRDVTREIAEDVLREADADLDVDGYPSFGGLTDFLETFCGCRTVQEHAAETMGAV